MDASNPSNTPFIASASLPFEKIERDEALRLINAGRRHLNPIPLKSGAFYFPQGGVYQLMAGPQGERVGVWAQNPADIKFETLEVDPVMAQTLRQYVVGADGIEREEPVAVGTKIPMRLMDQGNGNLERLRIFTIHPKPSAKKWWRESINLHQHAFQAYTETYGTLFRQSKTLWVSDGVVYEAIPAEGKDGKVVDGRYDLMMTVAPTHGWTLSKDYEKIKKGLSGRFLNVASVRAKNLSIEDIEKLVPEDFLKRSQKFVEGDDSYSVILNGKSNGRTPLRYQVRKQGTRFAYALSRLRGVKVLWRLGVVSAFNGSLAAFAYVVFGAPPFPWLMRIAGQTASGTGREMYEYVRIQKRQFDDPEVERLMKQYCQDFNPLQIWGSPINPDMARYLTPLSHDHLRTDLHPGERILDHVDSDEAALEYMKGTNMGPVGSNGRFFRIGNYLGFPIHEPSGLTMEYIPDLDVAYATMDWSRYDPSYLPGHTAHFMERIRDQGKLHVMVTYDHAQRRLVYKAMDDKSYFKDFDSMRTKSEALPVLHPPGIRLVPPPKPEAPRNLFGRLVRYGTESASEGGRLLAEQAGRWWRTPGIH